MLLNGARPSLLWSENMNALEVEANFNASSKPIGSEEKERKVKTIITCMQVNTRNIIYLNCEERYQDMIEHRGDTPNLSSCEIKPEKNSGLNGIRTHDLCDTAVAQCSAHGLESHLLWSENTNTLVLGPYTAVS